MGNKEGKVRKMNNESKLGTVAAGQFSSIGTHYLSSNVKFRSTYLRDESKKVKSSQFKADVEEIRRQSQQKFRDSFSSVMSTSTVTPTKLLDPSSKQRSNSTPFIHRPASSTSHVVSTSGLKTNTTINKQPPKGNFLLRPFSELNLSKRKRASNETTSLFKNDKQNAHNPPSTQTKSRIVDVGHNSGEDTLKRDNVYPLKSSPRGYCLIIANINFRLASQLPGNGHDANRIRDVFQSFGFIVRKYENCTAKEMRAIFEKYSKDPELEKHDAFVVFISTHGNYLNGKELFLGSDDDYMFREDILSYFNNRKCPKLIGKPKIFLIDACRGGEEDSGIVIQRNATPFIRSDQLFVGKKIPEWSDILIYSSSVVGYVSWGSKSGSFFTNVLTDSLKKYAHSYDLVTILEKVTQKVVEEDTSNKLQAPSEEKRGWTKKVYF
ncbi:cell death protein 3-like protein [Leptotrombidium deliense]|uniref:Cell death protein 3-like protein n=1 Tax=Leptotrombidium deliense TaxID=299467 RepID=A0A443SSQ5_9ACAR|nr:cell death protein 3-like protein [Leptotrombidium deliense]